MATEINKILLELEFDSKGVISNLDQVQAKLKGLGVDMGKTGKQFQDFGKKAKDVGSAAGIAGAAAAEFGRTISDIPFGITAITNNVSQLGSMLSLLVAKTGSVSEAYKELKAVFMGPAGVLVLFQVAVAAVELFAQSQKKAKDEVQGLDAALKAQGKTYDELSNILNNVNESDDRRLSVLRALSQFNKDLAKIANDENLTIEERIELGNRLNQAKIREKEIQRDATDELVKRNKLYANLTVSEEELQKRIDRRAKTVETLERGYLEVARNGAIVRANLSLEQRQQIETTLDGLDREINAIREGIPIRDAIISQLESLTGHQETINEITEEYSELTKSREKTAIQGTIQAIKEKIAKLEEQRDTTGTTLLQIRKYNEEIALLKKQLEQLESGGVIQKVTNSLGQQGAVLGKALVEGPQLTEAQKLAKDALKKVGEAGVEGFQESIESQGERNFFLDTFGISEENLQAGIAAAQTALNTLGDVFSAQAEREIAVETNRTNQLNDQLKQRLANEQLSADERDKINQEIARNEAQLVAKENQINKKRFEQEKAVNIALATVNTFSAATGVLAETKGGTFARIAGMIAVIGAGLAQVAIIAKQQFTAKAMPSPNLSGLGGAGGAGGAEPQFNVIGATGQNQLAAAIAATQQQPVKAYVVSNDVTTAQSLDRNIVAEASL